LPFNIIGLIFQQQKFILEISSRNYIRQLLKRGPGPDIAIQKVSQVAGGFEFVNGWVN